MEAIYVISRIVHIGTAIVVVGGSVFLRCVLLPAVKSMSPAEHDQLRARVLGIWKKFVHGGIALFLLSGGINYAKVIVEHSHKGDGLYHGLLGTKILLALAVFFIASALVGRSAKFQGMRQNTGKWLGVCILLAAIIVSISGFLKVRGTGFSPSPQETASLTTGAVPDGAK